MWRFSCICVFLPPDTKNGNQDTRFILKDQEKELGYWGFGCFIYLTLKKKDQRVYQIARFYDMGIVELFQELMPVCEGPGVEAVT